MVLRLQMLQFAVLLCCALRNVHSLQTNKTFVICGFHEYYRVDIGMCEACAMCREGQITQRSCGGVQNTECGPFSDFVFPNGQKDPLDEKKPTESTPQVESADEEERQWKMLAFALMGITSFLLIVATIFVILSCHRFRKYNKIIVSDQAHHVENDYVVIHKFIPPAAPSSVPASSVHDDHVFVEYRTRNNRYTGYKPKRRLMNEYVDDVFESDDSAGSRSIGLPTILEREGESPS